MPVRKMPVLAYVAATLLFVAPAPAGLMDSIKKKVNDKTSQKAGKAVDDADKKASGDKADTPPEAGAAADEKSSGGSRNGKVSGVSTKFDFVPGDSVLFVDDFTQDDLGE